MRLMNCSVCFGNRVTGLHVRGEVRGHVSDRDYSGSVPPGLPIGQDNQVKFEYCLDCGKIQGKFPVQKLEIEKHLPESVLMDFFLEHELMPYGEISSDNFKIMVDRASTMSVEFGSFILYCFRSSKNRFDESIQYHSPVYYNWSELFQGYKSYADIFNEE